MTSCDVSGSSAWMMARTNVVVIVILMLLMSQSDVTLSQSRGLQSFSGVNGVYTKLVSTATSLD